MMLFNSSIHKKNIVCVLFILIFNNTFSQWSMLGLTSKSANGTGTVYAIDSIGNNFTKLVDLEGFTGNQPCEGLSKPVNGKSYGYTKNGGLWGHGTLFEFDINTQTFTKKLDITAANSIGGANIFCYKGNGKYSCLSNTGTGEYEYDANTNTLLNIPVTVSNSISGIETGLLKASNGKYYGLSKLGSVSGGGILFEYNEVLKSYTTLYAFTSSSNPTLSGSFLLEYSGKLYGTTSNGGTNNVGSLFSYDLSTNTYTQLYSFNSTLGGAPKFSIKQYNNAIYGICSTGGASNYGSIFKYDVSSGIVTSYYNFTSAYYNHSHIFISSNGNLYGSTWQGGSSNSGVVYKINLSTNTSTVVANLGGTNGRGGCGDFVEDNTIIYGLTHAGGMVDAGVLVSVNTTSQLYTPIINLCYNKNGHSPQNHFKQFSNGKIYTTCVSGGTTGNGSLIEYDPCSNSINTVFNLTNTTGNYPYGNVTEYGSKYYGLAYGSLNGQLFEYTPTTSNLTVRYTFPAPFSNGCNPYGELTDGGNGKLYGMTYWSSPSTTGVIFEFDPATNVYTKKVSLTSASGINPYGSFIKAANGKLYGMTSSGGGTNGRGTIIEYDQNTNILTKKFTFANATGGAPYGNLIEYAPNIFYGLTTSGVSTSTVSTTGTIFKYDLNTGILTNEFIFTNYTDSSGAWPMGSLYKSVSGRLYGVTNIGGDYNMGVLFEYDPVGHSYTKKYDFNPLSGGFPTYSQLFETCLTPVVGQHSPSVVTATLGTGTTLFANYLNSGTLSFQWYKNGTLLAGETNDSLNFTNVNLSDTATYYCEVSNYCGSCNSPDIKLSTTNIVTSIINNGNSVFAIYPNPSNGVFVLQDKRAKVLKADLDIYDIHGKKIVSYIDALINNLKIDLSSQPNGIYFVNIKTQEEVTTKKIIINK